MGVLCHIYLVFIYIVYYLQYYIPFCSFYTLLIRTTSCFHHRQFTVQDFELTWGFGPPTGRSRDVQSVGPFPAKERKELSV